jgi:acyl carrier protein
MGRDGHYVVSSREKHEREDMTQQEKIGLLEELFEVDSGVITPEKALDTLQWDSMAMLSLIAMVNERFGKRVPGAQLKAFKTVQDILAVME